MGYRNEDFPKTTQISEYFGSKLESLYHVNGLARTIKIETKGRDQIRSRDDNIRM